MALRRPSTDIKDAAEEAADALSSAIDWQGALQKWKGRPS
jgi:hypothetical protein